MNNPYKPPQAPVADINPTPGKPTWPRTALLIAGCGMLSLALAWLVAPVLATQIAQLFGLGGQGVPPALLVMDMAFSIAAFVAGGYLAAKLSRGHPFAAAAGVGFAGWLVYFVEVGGLEGMLHSQLPLWYEFFPSHGLAALIAWLLARHGRESSPPVNE